VNAKEKFPNISTQFLPPQKPSQWGRDEAFAPSLKLSFNSYLQQRDEGILAGQ
jgi:hypothetical protein